MKKIIFIITSACIISMSLSNFAFATIPVNGDIESPCSNAPSYGCKSGLTCVQTSETIKKNSDGTIDNTLWGTCKSIVDALTQRPPVDATNPDARNVKALPDVSLEGGMTLAIKAMLRSAMYLTIIAIVVAAIYYIISRGKDEDMTKAKDIILYLVIGMAIIAAAYGVVAGVTQFNVFG